MSVEKPLNIEQFFQSRTEIATRHNNKLEFQVMSRVREHLVEVQAEEAKKQVVDTTKKK